MTHFNYPSKKTDKEKYSMKLTATFYDGNKTNFIAAALSMLYNGIMFVLVAVVMQKILDIAAGKDAGQIKGAICMAAIYIIMLVSGWLVERFFKNRFIEKALRQYKNNVFSHLMQKSIAAFGNDSTSRCISTLTNDINSIDGNYLQSGFTILLNSVYIVFAMAVMLWYHVGLAIAALGFTAATVAVSVALGGRLAICEKQISLCNEDFVGSIKDFFGGFFAIKSFKAESEVTGLFGRKNALLEQVKCRRRKTEALIILVGSGMGLFTQAGIMILGVYFTIRGQITAGVLVAFIQLMNFVTMPIQTIPTALANRKAAAALIDKIVESLSAETGVSGRERLIGDIGNIELRHLSYGYNDDENVLDDVTLSFEQGKCYAVMGASGSGKSTLLNVLAGSLRYYAGSAAYQSKELRDIAYESLFDAISVIWQNVYVFNDSVENNITMFKSIDSPRIDSAVKRAGLSGLVDEKGYGYACGENGSGLSGGERQRVAIARSLLKDTRVLLADEATSALDSVTAALIENTILSMEGITRIVITHKTEADILRRYDGIVVLQNGKVAGCGSFEELMDECVYFKNMLTCKTEKGIINED